MAAQTQGNKSSLGLWLLLLLLLGIGLLLVLPSLNLQTNTATQTASQGQCLDDGQNFDKRQEAFTLAQTAEQYRSVHPYGGNFGFGSYTICFKDGSQQRVQSPPAPGYSSTPTTIIRENDTHSEQGIYNWLKRALSGLSLDQSQVAAIYTMIFSQVSVCAACQRDMVTWQRGLREAAGTDNVYLSVWDIRPGSKSGFNPTIYRAGTGIPVAIVDLEKVMVAFAP